MNKVNGKLFPQDDAEVRINTETWMTPSKEKEPPPPLTKKRTIKNNMIFFSKTTLSMSLWATF